MEIKLLSMDTNVLLDLYRYTKETTAEILKYFEEAFDEIYIAPTVIEEYDRHYKRERAHTGSRNPINNYQKRFHEYFNNINTKLTKLKTSSLIDGLTHGIGQIIEDIETFTKFKKTLIENEIETLKTQNSFSYNEDDDIVYDFVEKYSTERLATYTKIEWAQKADSRFKHGLFPGLTDLYKTKYSKQETIKK